jgi:hypothetical protein
MPGPRYEGWYHLRVEGDPGIAAKHLSTARKVLGAVAAEAARNNLTTHKRVLRPEPGVELVGEIHGEQPRIVIRVTGGEGDETKQRMGDFVVWARDQAQPDGIDADHPQQILKPEWRTFFFDEDVPAYEAFPRKKGTYRFGEGGVELFPDGIRHAGNIDWRASTGERISWYGPSSRYWFDRWRQPSEQYGRFVFLMGQILLDIDEYCTAADVDFAERLVLGAALDGTSLLVMQADMPDLPAPAVPVGRPGDVYLTPPCPVDDVALRLVRYPLLIDPSEPPTQRVFLAVGDHETLWTGSGAGWVNPWSFDSEGERAETFAMPEDMLIHQYRFEFGADYDYRLPSATSEHLTLTIGSAIATLATADASLQMNQPEAFAPVAVDYDYRGNRVLLEFGYRAVSPVPDYASVDESQVVGFTPWANYLFRANGREVPIYELLDPVNDIQRVRWRRPVTMDLRFRTFGFIEIEQAPDFQFEARLSFVSRPDLTTAVPLVAKQVINGGPPGHTAWHAICFWAGAGAIAPLAMLAGAVLIGREGSVFGPGYYTDIGFNPMWFLPAADQLFGTVAFYDADNGSILSSQTTFQDQGFTTYWNNREDFDGKRNPAGMAIGDDHLLYSGPGWFDDYNEGDLKGAHFVTGSDLGVLTGVAGADPSYHPIWILGEIPLIAR